MPTYEYLCGACGHRLEVVQRFKDDPLTTCDQCGGALRRVFHPVGVVLKGSGFYATDNRSGKSLQPGEKRSDSSSEKRSESSSASASEKSSGSSSEGSGSSGSSDKKPGTSPKSGSDA